MLSENAVIAAGAGDVGRARERTRGRRLGKLALVGLIPLAWLWSRLLTGKSAFPSFHLPPAIGPALPLLLLVVILGVALLAPLLMAGRSPHVLFRSTEIETSFADVKGADVIVEEVVKTLNLFLAHKTFKETMGGTPRRAILFEGPPGTGKTYMAKAMAREAGVPFLFVSSSAFQSMYYGQTNRKIRSYFKALRDTARREGGAIGFIEEIDAIGSSRAGMGGAGGRSEGITGVVNELLIQLQSFDTPPNNVRVHNWFVEVVNRFLPRHRQLHKKVSAPANILVIGATNRAADLDPALLRPGRFDRSIYFDLPSRAGRREIIDYYLAKKAHEPELDDASKRDALAAMTARYSPVMIENVLDEALIWSLRRGATRLSWADLQRAKMTQEIGLAQPIEYTEAERRTIATHEAGHAVVAWLAGKGRKLEILSIIKRKEALGLLAHSDIEERFLKSESELRSLILIAMGGLAAEEVFFGEITSGPSSDLQVATTYAAMMIGSLGMDGTLFSFEAIDSPHANLVAKVTGTEGGQERIEALLRKTHDEARDMIDRHRHLVEALRDALLRCDELIGDEITDIIVTAATSHDGALDRDAPAAGLQLAHRTTQVLE